MLRIVVSIREKRSTTSQFENCTVGCDIEANNLEIATPEAVVEKTRQLFVLARSAVQAELLHAVPERSGGNGGPRVGQNGGAAGNGHHVNGNGHHNGNGHPGAHANGHANGHNGNGRSFGRPSPEPSPKQRILLQRLAKERGMTAEQVGEVSRREFGKNLPQLDRHEMSRLLEMLMEQEARP